MHRLRNVRETVTDFGIPRSRFILQGAVTFVIAIMGAFILPDFPLTTKWLSPEQRKLAHERIERDTVDLQEKGTTWQGLLQALKDYRVWLFCFMQYVPLLKVRHSPEPCAFAND